jgi:hypothetical protein
LTSLLVTPVAMTRLQFAALVTKQLQDLRRLAAAAGVIK